MASEEEGTREAVLKVEKVAELVAARARVLGENHKGCEEVRGK